jgi:hypothetical protein
MELNYFFLELSLIHGLHVISIRKRINYPEYYSVYSLWRQRNVEFTCYIFAVRGIGISLTHLAHAENALDYAHSSVQHLDSHGMVCKHLLCLPMTTFLLYLLWGNIMFFFKDCICLRIEVAVTDNPVAGIKH